MYFLLTFTIIRCIIILQFNNLRLFQGGGKRVREWLIKLRGNASQGDIAKKLGITQQYYSYIENGERQKKMDIQICEKIAHVFGISVEDVIKFETERA